MEKCGNQSINNSQLFKIQRSSIKTASKHWGCGKFWCGVYIGLFRLCYSILRFIKRFQYIHSSAEGNCFQIDLGIVVLNQMEISL